MTCSWIWLPKDVYPENQSTIFDIYTGDPNAGFTVADFTKTYFFDREIASVTAIFSANSYVELFCNGVPVGTGPASVGGDFLENGKAREWYYANEVTFALEGRTLEFFARVRMNPIRMYEYSKGRGGFMLSATVSFKDGSSLTVSTDETWLTRKNGAFVNSFTYDGRILPDPYTYAESVPDVWNAKLAPIPVTREQEIALGRVTVAPKEEITKSFELDRIYAGLLHLRSRGEGTVQASMHVFETEFESEFAESATLCGDDRYRSFYLQSVGRVDVTLKNESEKPLTVDVSVIAVCYPVDVDAKTETSDEELRAVLDVCKHTLKYCRQTHHLDSPRHCEPLACTGDYYIESLMTAFSFGDMRLAEFDVERTAELLRHNDGRMFHTTYSLIWVRMLYDVYMIGGKSDLLKVCRDALDLLFARFESYLGENGLLEKSPDYMFVDWIYVDNLSMHHPPKALGQTVLNLFYYMALEYGEKIYALLGDGAASARCEAGKNALRTAVNTLLYDKERGMYFEGLNTPNAHESDSWALPKNVEKRYYRNHSNIFAAYTGDCDGEIARSLIEKVMKDEIEGDVQPYFLHYLLEAIYTHGFRETYTLAVIERWKPAVKRCGKGLVEGFVAPEPTYVFDHSHAWGGTPLYSLPKALTGLEILEAGYRRIRLHPTLLGLKRARIEIPTPYGMVVCEMEQGRSPRITAPEEILVEIL